MQEESEPKQRYDSAAAADNDMPDKALAKMMELLELFPNDTEEMIIYLKARCPEDPDTLEYAAEKLIEFTHLVKVMANLLILLATSASKLREGAISAYELVFAALEKLKVWSSMRMLHRALESTGPFEQDASMRYLDVDDDTARLLGLPKADILGRSNRELFGDANVSDLQKLPLGDYELHFLVQHCKVTKKEDSSLVVCVFLPMLNLKGETEGYYGTCATPAQLEVSGSGLASEDVSPGMQEAKDLALKAAKVDTTVLLTGETGTGKDYLAEYIHENSPRPKKPFIRRNCAAIPETMAESELFGHERGAYTGADKMKKGAVELAEGGTLFLNEIGLLPMSLQGKLNTFLDNKTFTRMGGEKELTAKCRILAATNKDLEKEVEEGRFLPDLFYRLNVFRIELPPLRERVSEIPLLIQDLLRDLKKTMALPFLPEIDPSIYEPLKSYPWSGNIRELKNLLERAIGLSEGAPITADLILPQKKDKSEKKRPKSQPPEGGDVSKPPPPAQKDIDDACNRFRRLPDQEQGHHLKIILEKVCGRESGSKGCLAEVLGLTPPTINKRLKLVGGVKLKTGNPTTGARERLLRSIQEYLVDRIPK